MKMTLVILLLDLWSRSSSRKVNISDWKCYENVRSIINRGKMSTLDTPFRYNITGFQCVIYLTLWQINQDFSFRKREKQSVYLRNIHWFRKMGIKFSSPTSQKISLKRKKIPSLLLKH